ncbi:MAG: hypothetical protein ACRDJO_07275 [Actinomycetota bacterium]
MEISLVVAAPSNATAVEVVEAVTADVDLPVIVRNGPWEYDWDGGVTPAWEATIHLGPFDGNRPEARARVTRALADVDWELTFDDTHASWKHGLSQSPVLRHPAVRWASVWATGPVNPDPQPDPEEDEDPPSADDPA